MSLVKNIITKRIFQIGSVLVLGIIMLIVINGVKASDHDDGETDSKGRNLNLTDVYVFREQDQNASMQSDDLILIMNTNPRSLPRQQYYFSTNARYEFKISRVSNADDMAKGQTDTVLRFEFGAPNMQGQQEITVTSVSYGFEEARTRSLDNNAIVTTPLGSEIINNTVALGADDKTMTIYAGLREDPFFFDVEQYFRVRAGAAGIGPAVGFREPGYDFTAGYNVNSIVVRIPKAFLQGNTEAQVFDVWATISVPDANGDWVQVERLARPAINEGLVLTNDYLNALNSVGPDFEAAALAGEQPAADIAGPIVSEVINTLKAVGNDDERALALVKAFLPDVMRIDTSGPSGYANALNALGSPIRGRLIKDDVIDITLSVLTNGGITSDNVSYEGPNAGGAGHKPLMSQFPYLAPAN